MNIGIAFPFNVSSQGGRFQTTKTTRDAIKTNLISLMTTKPGQRPMRSNVYSPFYNYIFDPWDNITEDMLEAEVRQVIEDVIPEIKLEELIFEFDETTYVLRVRFSYSIVVFNSLEDEVNLSFQFQNPVA